jgi:threonine dehydratase
MTNTFDPRTVEDARVHLRGVVSETPLQFHPGLSEKFAAKIYLKREDLQVVRSYKLRGAYNRMRLLSPTEKKRGVVCASAGNHAQGVAFSCKELGISGTIFMPKNTPRQKLERVRILGNSEVKVELFGDTYDEAYGEARRFADKQKKTFIHPFNDSLVIAGQGTVGAEILEQLQERIDYVVMPVGGGGLMAGVGGYMKFRRPSIRVVGVESEGAPGMTESLKAGKVVSIKKMDPFVDGTAVRTVGDINFGIIKKIVNKMVVVPEGKVCRTMIRLYQRDGIVTEPSGALSIAGLDDIAKQIKGKTVVCVISGGNNDISRYPEIIERSLIYQGLKHYFMVNFSQRPGTLRRYLNEALGPTDDITLFEYVKKNNRETGPALVGIELAKKEDFEPLLKRMDKIGMNYEIIKGNTPQFAFLV